MTRSGILGLAGFVVVVLLAASAYLLLSPGTDSRPSPRPSETALAPSETPASSPPPTGAGAQAQGGEAEALLKAMSDYVGSQKTIEFIFDSATDVAPIVIFLFAFQLFVIRERIPNLHQILVGFGFVVVGLGLFLVGLEESLFPLGRLMAQQLTGPSITGVDGILIMVHDHVLPR